MMKRVPDWKIAQMRLTHKYTQAEVTRMTGLPRRTVRRIMSGTVKKPTSRTKSALTRAFHKVEKIDYRSYEISVPSIVKRTFDADIDANAVKWANMYRRPPLWAKRPDSVYYKIYYTVTTPTGDFVGNGEINSPTFHNMSEDAWETAFFHIWTDAIVKLGTHVSNGEAILTITGIQLRATWKL